MLKQAEDAVIKNRKYSTGAEFEQAIIGKNIRADRPLRFRSEYKNNNNTINLRRANYRVPIGIYVRIDY